MVETPIAKPWPLSERRRRRLPFRRRLRLPIGPVLLIAGFLGLFAIVLLFPRGIDLSGSPWVNLGPVEQLPVGQPQAVPEHRLYLVKLESGEVLALFRRDPHLGCAIPWNPTFEFQGKTGWFREPCHNSTYDIAGNLVFGPSPRGMDRYPVRIVDGKVEVNLNQLIPGPTGDTPAPSPRHGLPAVN